MQLRLLRHGHPLRPTAARLYPTYGTAAWLRLLEAWRGDARGLEVYPLAARAETLVVARGEGVGAADWPAGGVGLGWLLPHVLAPVGAALSAGLTESEAGRLFDGARVLWLPGRAPLALPAPLDWADAFAPPAPSGLTASAPPPPHRPPMRLGAVVAPPPAARLEDIVREADDTDERLRPLTPAEQLRRKTLETLLRGGALGRRLAAGMTDGRDPREELDELNRRDGDEVRRLERLYEDDPLAALRHSAPLDTTGTADPYETGAGAGYRLREYWRRLGLDATERNSARGGGGMEGSDFERLQRLYESQARRLAGEGRHRESAFAWLKLLNRPRQAAEHLRRHGLYPEAADVYLRHCKLPLEAADCYREARLYVQALPLYEEARAYEPAGDCAHMAGWAEHARELYRRAVREHVAARELIKAEGVLSRKLHDRPAALALLDRGWREGTEAEACLKRTLAYLDDGGASLAYLLDTRADMTDARRQTAWMRGLAHVRRLHPEQAAAVWEAGLEMAAVVGQGNPSALRALGTLTEDAWWAREGVRAGR